MTPFRFDDIVSCPICILNTTEGAAILAADVLTLHMQIKVCQPHRAFTDVLIRWSPSDRNDVAFVGTYGGGISMVFLPDGYDSYATRTVQDYVGGIAPASTNV